MSWLQLGSDDFQDASLVKAGAARQGVWVLGPRAATTWTTLHSLNWTSNSLSSSFLVHFETGQVSQQQLQMAPRLSGENTRCSLGKALSLRSCEYVAVHSK